MQDALIPVRQFTRELVVAGAGITAAVGGLSLVLDAQLQPLAPLLLFVVLLGLAQMIFHRLSLRTATLMGAVIFPAAAVTDPWLKGALRYQEVGVLDALWLAAAGGVTGYLGGGLMLHLFEVGAAMQSGHAARVYSVPRRFGIGTILLATTLFAVLFGVLNYARARPWELFFYASFVATVSLFQAVFQRAPRWASILAGGFFLPLSMIIFGSMGRRWLLPRVRVDSLLGPESFLLIAGLIGMVVGYLGGTLIAGVFLVSDYVVRFFGSWAAHKAAVERIDAEVVPGGTLSLLAERAAAARRETA